MFDLGVESCFEIPQYIILSFENDNVNAQASDGGILKEMKVTDFFSQIGIVRYHENRMTVNNGTNNYNIA